jgi:hypothetical protein
VGKRKRIAWAEWQKFHSRSKGGPAPGGANTAAALSAATSAVAKAASKKIAAAATIAAAVAITLCEAARATLPTAAAAQRTCIAAKKEVAAVAVGSAGVVMIPSPPAPPAKRKWSHPQPDNKPGGLKEAIEVRWHTIPQLNVSGTQIRHHSRPPPFHCPHRHHHLTTWLPSRTYVAFVILTVAITVEGGPRK